VPLPHHDTSNRPSGRPVSALRAVGPRRVGRGDPAVRTPTVVTPPLGTGFFDEPRVPHSRHRMRLGTNHPRMSRACPTPASRMPMPVGRPALASPLDYRVSAR
jgi:hypothetical protein